MCEQRGSCSDLYFRKSADGGGRDGRFLPVLRRKRPLFFLPSSFPFPPLFFPFSPLSLPPFPHFFFFFAFHKYLSSIYHVPGTVLGTADGEVSKATSLCICSHEAYGLIGRRINKQQISIGSDKCYEENKAGKGWRGVGRADHPEEGQGWPFDGVALEQRPEVREQAMQTAAGRAFPTEGTAFTAWSREQRVARRPVRLEGSKQRRRRRR